MKLELLVSAVNADIKVLIEKMHIRTDAVCINQCGYNRFEVINLSDTCDVRVFDCNERGVGVSRNKAIENATGDILLFADDDIEYRDDYAETVLKEFENHPEADAMFFNLEVCEERRTYYNEDFGRVHIWNGGRYPAYSIAIRKDALDKAEVRFSTLFGGGAKYSCGEDSLFIRDCLKAGVKMYRTTALIGREVPRDGGESTWFKGYNEKFFYDRGVLYHFLYGALAPVMGFRFVFTKRKEMCRDIKWTKAYGLLLKGTGTKERR